MNMYVSFDMMCMYGFRKLLSFWKHRCDALMLYACLFTLIIFELYWGIRKGVTVIMTLKEDLLKAFQPLMMVMILKEELLRVMVLDKVQKLTKVKLLVEVKLLITNH